jgi:hypothetical protein
MCFIDYTRFVDNSYTFLYCEILPPANYIAQNGKLEGKPAGEMLE